MNPMRRAVVRAAVLASRVPPTKTPMLAVTSKIAVAKIAAPATVRCFSQTLRVANEDNYSQTLRDEDDGSLYSGQAADEGSSYTGQAAEDLDATTRLGKAEESGYGLFIRNMVFEANEDHLQEAYEKYGKITKAAVARDARGLSRGYGFVWFTTKEAMEQAVAGTNASFWHGRRISVSPRLARNPGNVNKGVGPTRSMYIGNIPYETTDAELNRIFRQLDDVTDVRVAVDRTTGWPRGFAHADFKSVEACTAGIEKLKGTTIGGRELRLDYAMEVTRGGGQS